MIELTTFQFLRGDTVEVIEGRQTGKRGLVVIEPPSFLRTDDGQDRVEFYNEVFRSTDTNGGSGIHVELSGRLKLVHRPNVISMTTLVDVTTLMRTFVSGWPQIEYMKFATAIFKTAGLTMEEGIDSDPTVPTV